MSDSYDSKIQEAMGHLIPVYTHLELTYRCNEKCVHCYATVNHSSKKELTVQEYKSIFDQLADLGTLYLAMTGGEILVRQDFFDIAQYAKKKAFALRLFTNGISITENVAKQIADLNPLRVEISLYGMSPNIHDKITQIAGSFIRTRDSILLLSKMGINLTIKVPAMRENIDEILLIKKFTEDHGLEFISNPLIVPMGNGCLDNLQYRLTDKQLKFFYQHVNNEWFFNTPALDKTLCNAGKGIMSISPYGEVFPCVQVQTLAGDLRKQSLSDIWFNSQVLTQIRSLSLSRIKGCSNCDNIEYCNPCPGLALAEDGDIYTNSSEACRQAKVRKTVFANKKDWQPTPDKNSFAGDCIV